MDPLAPKFTGRKRHRIQKIGWFKPKFVLVLQYEIEGFVPGYSAGRVDGNTKRWWVDARPEWEMINVESKPTS